MQDDQPQAQDQPPREPQPSEPPNRPEPASEVRVSASESASTRTEQPQAELSQPPVASESARTQPQPAEGIPTPQPPQASQEATSEAVSMSTSPQTVPSGSTPLAQEVPPESEQEKEENQTPQAATEPQSKPEPEAKQPQNSPSPSPPSIPSLHYPFYGSYPATFDFGAQPTDEQIKQKYQEWGIVRHNGLDFGLQEGTEVLACDEGVVTQAGDNGDFGISITVKHSWGTSLYAHLQSFGVLVNDHVTKARVIGASGQTGFTTGQHLHFGIQPVNPDTNNGYLGYIDPKPYLLETSEKLQPEDKSSDLSPDLSVSPPISPQSPVSPLPRQTPGPVSEPTQPPSPPIVVPDLAEVERLAQEKMKANWQQYQHKGNPAKHEKKEASLQKIFAFAQEKKRITNEQVRDLLHISQSTATDYLSELVNRGMVRVEGKGKATIYLF